MKRITFDEPFEFGVATASYQIEGAWNEGGKGESNWDRFTHTPGNIVDGTNADVACDFYHRYKEDIQLAADLGFKVFRLSVSWSRIFPAGVGEINQEGIDFYRNVLETIKGHGMKVSLTIFHWDLPQRLQDRGGWGNRDIVGWYTEYAKVLFREYGDLVDYWITLNEPINPSILGYWTGEHAPGYHDYSLALTAVHHLLLAHGSAVREFRKLGLKSEIGITLNMNYAYPADPDNAADVAAARRMMDQNNSLFGDPVWNGEYPAELFSYLSKQGVVLPEIREGDMELIHQPLDFFGLNNYFADVVRADTNEWPLCARTVKCGRPQTDANWEVWPDGLYDLLIWINRRYAPPKLIITENGTANNDWVDVNGRVEDPKRIDFFKQYLAEVRHAMDDGVPVTAYYVWSFYDNFEWAWGLQRRFGIVYVNYQTQERIVKKSGYWFSELIQNRGYDFWE